MQESRGRIVERLARTLCKDDDEDPDWPLYDDEGQVQIGLWWERYRERAERYMAICCEMETS